MSTDAPERATSRLREGVAEEIRGLLGRRRMSQIELARRIGKSHTYVGRRLSGETAFDTDDLERIAGILGVSVVDLLPDSALGPTGLRGRMPIAPASLPDRPSDRRGPTRPGSHRPPSGPGRTSRLAVS